MKNIGFLTFHQIQIFVHTYNNNGNILTIIFRKLTFDFSVIRLNTRIVIKGHHSWSKILQNSKVAYSIYDVTEQVCLEFQHFFRYHAKSLALLSHIPLKIHNYTYNDENFCSGAPCIFNWMRILHMKYFSLEMSSYCSSDISFILTLHINFEHIKKQNLKEKKHFVVIKGHSMEKRFHIWNQHHIYTENNFI